MSAFGARLRALRQAAGWRGAALARAAGCDPSYITRLERGERHPSRAMVAALVAALFRAAGYCPAPAAPEEVACAEPPPSS